MMSDWHDFFVAQVGASGVLAGLVFVGVSINLEKIMSTPAYGLPGRTLEALIVLLAVLTVSSVLLVPGQGTLLVGAEVLAVGVVDCSVNGIPKGPISCGLPPGFRRASRISAAHASYGP